MSDDAGGKSALSDGLGITGAEARESMKTKIVEHIAGNARQALGADVDRPINPHATSAASD